METLNTKRDVIRPFSGSANIWRQVLSGSFDMCKHVTMHNPPSTVPTGERVGGVFANAFLVGGTSFVLLRPHFFHFCFLFCPACLAR